MTIEEKADLIGKLARLDPSIPMGIAVNDTVDEYYNRIFVSGKLTDGGAITYKSDNPVYINSKDGSPKKLTPEGKPELTTKKINSFTKVVVSKKKGNRFKSVQGPQFTRRIEEHKTTYFTSYKAFKAKIGKPILELFGTLQSSIAKGATKTTDNTYVLAVPGVEADKIEGLQFGNGKWSGLGTIFKLNEKEKLIYKETFMREYLKRLNGTADN